MAKEIWCPICERFQPLIEEPMQKDGLNEHPWGDLVCGYCHLIIATVREPCKKFREKEEENESGNASNDVG